jgi:general stress protein 26
MNEDALMQQLAGIVEAKLAHRMSHQDSQKIFHQQPIAFRHETHKSFTSTN